MSLGREGRIKAIGKVSPASLAPHSLQERTLQAAAVAEHSSSLNFPRFTSRQRWKDANSARCSKFYGVWMKKMQRFVRMRHGQRDAAAARPRCPGSLPVPPSPPLSCSCPWGARNASGPHAACTRRTDFVHQKPAGGINLSRPKHSSRLAVEQGEAAAAALCKGAERGEPCPWLHQAGLAICCLFPTCSFCRT